MSSHPTSDAAILAAVRADADAERLDAFVRESNRIEGIHRDPTLGELAAHDTFIRRRRVTVQDLEQLVSTIAGVPLRRGVGQDVRIGNHRPPRGGPSIEGHLDDILVAAHSGKTSPFELHRRYEHLHPFLDGNGRSGRALWAWQMLRQGEDPFALPFLHRFYYQSLDAIRS